MRGMPYALARRPRARSAPNGWVRSALMPWRGGVQQDARAWRRNVGGVLGTVRAPRSRRAWEGGRVKLSTLGEVALGLAAIAVVIALVWLILQVAWAG